MKDFGFEFDSLHPEHTLRAFGTVADIYIYIEREREREREREIVIYVVGKGA